MLDRKKPVKKLSLKRETVRVLTASDLAQAGGGYEPRGNTNSGMNTTNR